MIWQDVLLMGGSIAFSLALIPMAVATYRRKNTVSRLSSALTGSVLLIYAGTYLTLGLVYAAITTAFTAGVWLYILGVTLWRDKLHNAISPGGFC